jgi:hypothetical protein
VSKLCYLPGLTCPGVRTLLLSTAVIMLVFTKRTWLICSTIMLQYLIICCHFRLPKIHVILASIGTVDQRSTSQQIEKRTPPRFSHLASTSLNLALCQQGCSSDVFDANRSAGFSHFSSSYSKQMQIQTQPLIRQKTNWSILQFRFQDSNRANS